jgi:hypothetical protein
MIPKAYFKNVVSKNQILVNPSHECCNRNPEIYIFQTYSIVRGEIFEIMFIATCQKAGFCPLPFHHTSGIRKYFGPLKTSQDSINITLQQGGLGYYLHWY